MEEYIIAEAVDEFSDFEENGEEYFIIFECPDCFAQFISHEEYVNHFILWHMHDHG